MEADPNRSSDLEDRFRRMAVAVAEQTTATPRALGDDRQLPSAASTTRDPWVVRAVSVAAAMVLVIGLTVAVIAARRSTSGDVSTVDPATGEPASLLPVPGDLPTLAPSWLPDSLVLDAAAVTPGAELEPTWIRRYRAPSPTGDGPGVELRVTVNAVDPTTPSDPPITNPEVAQQVEVNGREAWVNHFFEVVPQSADPRLSGHAVRWDEPDGTQVDVSVRAMSPEQAVEVARGVRIVGGGAGVTAEMDPAALPPGYVEVYAGPWLPGFSAGSGPPTGAVGLGYAERVPAWSRGQGPDPGISIDQTRAPDIGLDTWIASFGPDVDVFTAGDVTFVAADVGSADQPVRIAGLGHGAVVSIYGSSLPAADVRRVAESIRPLDAGAWSAYLASARRTPYPPRVEAVDAAPVCAELRRLGDEAFASMRAGAVPSAEQDVVEPIGDGTALAALAERAPEPLPDALRVLASYQAHAGAALGAQVAPDGGAPNEVEPWWLEHDDVIALRGATRTVDGWSATSCLEETSVTEIFLGRPPLPDLSDQDPALDGFCRAWQDLRRRMAAEGYPLGSSASYAVELGALLPLVPGGHDDLLARVGEVRDVWAATPDGQSYPVGVDRSLGNLAPINDACPDWPN